MDHIETRTFNYALDRARFVKVSLPADLSKQELRRLIKHVKVDTDYDDNEPRSEREAMER